MNPAYSDELQFVTFTDSSSGGPCVKFRLPSREMLESFVGKEGKRFAAVLIEIGDDEQPAATNPTPEPEKAPEQPDRPKALPLAQSAGIICETPMFKLFAESHGYEATEEGAASLVRHFCHVTSRRLLDGDQSARKQFELLMSQYREWSSIREP